MQNRMYNKNEQMFGFEKGEAYAKGTDLLLH